MQEICFSLLNKPFLLNLDLSFDYNEINDYGGIHLGKAISYMTNLKVLDISLLSCDMIPSVAEKLCLSL